MNSLRRTIYCLVAAAVLPVCGDESTEWRPVTFEDFVEAQYFRVDEPGVRVFTDETSWQEFYDQYWSASPELPDVDFDNETVIGVFWGSRPQGCHNWVNCLDVIGVDGDLIKIWIAPLPDLGPCDMIANPLHMIKVGMTDIDVVFFGHLPGASG